MMTTTLANSLIHVRAAEIILMTTTITHTHIVIVVIVVIDKVAADIRYKLCKQGFHLSLRKVC